jgi:hypothetical protein
MPLTARFTQGGKLGFAKASKDAFAISRMRWRMLDGFAPGFSAVCLSRPESRH